MKNAAWKLAMGLCFAAIALGAQAQVADKKALTLDGACSHIDGAHLPSST